MSGFWEKSGKLASKSCKKMNEVINDYQEEKSKYQKIAAKMDDKELISNYKRSSTHPIKQSCFKNELIKRGLIKPNKN